MDPFTAAIVASTVLKGVSKVFGFSEEKKRQKTNRRLASASASIQTRQLALRELQERRAAARKVRDLQTQVGTVQGAVRASAGAAGVGGSSVALLERDAEASGLRAMSDVRESYLLTVDEIQARRDAVGLELQSNLANNQGPSAGALLTSLGGDAVSAATDLYTFGQTRTR